MVDWWFVRHGESVANQGGWLSGHRDVPLSPRGVAQAHEARGALAAVPLSLVLTSDLDRALHTTRLVVEGRDLPVRTLPALRERRMGVLEGQDKTHLRRTGELQQLFAWRTAPEGAESFAELARRVLPALAAIDDAGPVLVVAHGGVIRMVLGLLDGLPTEQLVRWDIPNGTPLHRAVPPGRFQQLIDHGDDR